MLELVKMQIAEQHKGKGRHFIARELGRLAARRGAERHARCGRGSAL